MTSIGRIFKFNLSTKIFTPTTKQSQGLILAKLLPTEKIVSCCPHQNSENIYLVSKQGKIFCINSNEVYYANEYNLGYLNKKTQLKNDYFLKILGSNHYLDIETNLLNIEEGEYLENCFRLEKVHN